MNTNALILMLSTQIIVTFFTIWFVIKILKNDKK